MSSETKSKKKKKRKRASTLDADVLEQVGDAATQKPKKIKKVTTASLAKKYEFDLYVCNR